MFSPELKVKRFLDSIGYYLLYGQMDGILTSYKEVVNAAREIPVSSCTSEVNNILYASGGAVDTREEKLEFQTMTSVLDDRVPKRKKPIKADRRVSRRQKIQMILDDHAGAEIKRYYVDRDGCFDTEHGRLSVIGCNKYNAKVVTRRNGETDILFDMDVILQCGDDWYDQNGDSIPDECIHRAVEIVDGYSDFG